MIDPAAVIRNQLDLLIAQQIVTLRKPSALTPEELDSFSLRSARISVLYQELDRRKPLPPAINPRARRIHVHPAA